MKNIAVIGSSGAIGSAFVRALVERDDVSKIYAFARSACGLQSVKITAGYIDITKEDTVASCAQTVSRSHNLDLILVTTGLLHEKDAMPEKAINEISHEKLSKMFLVNAIGPGVVMKHFLPRLRRDKPAILAVLSARIGSISDNVLGGWYSYRASKAALNMLVKCASIEMRRKYKLSIIVGLHPGTVESRLSKPFQQNIPEHKIFQPHDAAARMMATIDALGVEDSGRCFAYDGTEIDP